VLKPYFVMVGEGLMDINCEPWLYKLVSYLSVSLDCITIDIGITFPSLSYSSFMECIW